MICKHLKNPIIIKNGAKWKLRFFKGVEISVALLQAAGKKSAFLLCFDNQKSLQLAILEQDTSG